MSKQRKATRPTLEMLEDRCTPAFGFQGGAVIAHAQVVPLFLGSYWSTTAGMQSAAQINTYLSSLLNSSFMDQLTQYGVGRGALVGVGVIDSSVTGTGASSDSFIQGELANDLASGELPANSSSTLYIVFTPPDVSVSSTALNQQFDPLGYHSAFAYAPNNVVSYAVIINPVGNGTTSSLTAFQSTTLAVSKELANAVTDPTGNGWIDRSTGYEVGSLASQPGDYAFFNNYVVSGVWSAVQQTVVYPAGSTPPSFNLTPDQILSAGILAPVAGSFTTNLEYYDNVVATYYQNFLHRSASLGEENFWALGLASGERNELVLSMIAASDEYFTKAGGTNQDWIGQLYKDMLRRNVDQAGENSWLHALASGATRQQVAAMIASSSEREAIVVGVYYQSILGRTAASSDLTYWVSLIEAGATEEQVQTNILASGEFLTLEGGTLSGWLTGLYEATLKRAPDTAGFNAWLHVLDEPFAN
jgi:hypothetical protein